MPALDRQPVAAKQSRGRRTLLYFAAFFAAAQGLAGWALDRFGWAVRFPSMAARWEEVGKGPPPAVVWMGTSRSEGALRHDVTNRGLWARFGRHRVSLFNAAVPAGDPCAMELCLDWLLRHGHRPGLLVLEVGPAELARDCLWVGATVQRQMTWADLPAFFLPACRTNNAARLAVARLMPVYAHRRQLRLHLADFARRACSDGPVEPWAGHPRAFPYGDDFGPPPAVPPGLAGSTERVDFSLGNFAQFFRRYRIGGPGVDALERVLGRCGREGIAVTVVVPPFSRVARELCARPEVDRPFREHLEGLRRRHGVEVVDLQASLPDAAFTDLYHVGTAGSVLYSRLALERVVLPPLERRVAGR